MSTELRTESGAPLHPIGIGTYPMGSYQDPDTREIFPDYTNDERDIAAIAYSLRRGQNHIDTAELYGRGHTEELVGEALRQRHWQRLWRRTKREDAFVASKLWKESVAPENVEPSVEAMLGRLATDYVDLLYVHTPKYDTPWQAGLPAMNRLVDQGLVRHIGVSEFDLDQLRVAESISDYPIAALQLRYNVGRPEAITPALREYCEDRNIALVAYSPLGTSETLDRPEVKAVARKHRATPAQIALAWCMAHDTLPIPKAGSPRHIDDNLGAMGITLNRRDMQRLDV
jgi:diketogulonate reductase-like aldo/keto reductase